jgi:hypothetical protein
MFEAQLLLAGPSEGDQYKVFSPWFPRQGDNATFTIETVEQNGNPTLSVSAFTKNSEDAGDGSDADGGTSLTASTTAGERDSDTWAQKFKELVRYEFTITTSSGSGEWILFRMLPPVWFDDVHQA